VEVAKNVKASERGKIKVSISMFGRETPVELDFLQIKKL
jgi:transcriptional antiterminator NusG